MQMIKYNHPGNLNVFFRQHKDDPIPAWAVNVQPEASDEDRLRDIFRKEK